MKSNTNTQLPSLTVWQLRDLSQRFNHIPGVPIFSWWKTRKDCSQSAVHRPREAGICGTRVDGVFSIVLSGNYEDDEDMGDVVIYTGAGGREKWTDTEPPRRVRSNTPQTKDQSWNEHYNKALQVSSRTGKPVRVVRSYKCGSIYAPDEGYRYDGLYRVTKCWTGVGRISGLKICRSRLERLPDQPPLPGAELAVRRG